MNLQKLYQMQTELDNRIKVEHGLLETDVINEKILAFQVELAELANETRCFKYWSKKPASERVVILEEYVDGIHFLLSLGLDLGFDSLPIKQDLKIEESLTLQFLKLFQICSEFKQTKVETNFRFLFGQYLGLAQLLQFSIEEIETAYIGKNQVNHDRQTDGY